MKQLAKFEIAETYSNEPLLAEPSSALEIQNTGFALYPEETIVYHKTFDAIELNDTQNLVEHQILPSLRVKNGLLTYQSPFPVKRISNHTDVTLNVSDSDVAILPGESYDFNEESLFTFEFIISRKNQRHR